MVHERMVFPVVIKRKIVFSIQGYFLWLQPQKGFHEYNHGHAPYQVYISI
jgi:hypothetical protein